MTYRERLHDLSVRFDKAPNNYVDCLPFFHEMVDLCGETVYVADEAVKILKRAVDATSGPWKIAAEELVAATEGRTDV